MKTTQKLEGSRLLILTVFAGVILLTCSANSLAQQWNTNGNNISNANSGNVGIGTTAPETSLHVNGPVLTTGSIAGFNFRNRGSSSSADDWVWYSSGNVARFWRSNTDLLAVTTDGKVGFGLTSPYYKLDIGAGPGGGIGFMPGNVSGLGTNALLSRIVARGNYGSVDNSSAAEIRFLTGTDAWYRGQIAFFTNNYDSTQGGYTYERMRITNAGDVGIGTAAPDAARLHLYNAGNTYLRIGAPLANQSSIGFNDDVNGQDIVLYRPENSRDFVIWTATSSNVLRVMQSGSVGIGTNTPGYKFDVQGGQINASGGLCIAGDCKTAWSQVGGGGASQWTTSGSNIYYNAGSVGIGTTSPGSKLFVGSGTPAVATLAGLNVALGGASYVSASNGTENVFMGADGSGYGILGTLSNHSLGFRTNNSERVRIDTSGNVGIGTGAPTAKLHVAGDGRVTGNLTVDGNIAAKYQDVAEWVPSVHALPPGTVVTLNTTQSNLVEASSKAYDTRVAGVISERPGIALGEHGENKVLVATTGRVRLKVDATKAPIQIGDLLVTSEKEGVAMKSEPVTFGGVEMHRPGTIIGKALEPLAKGQGEILVLLSLQ